MTIYSILYGFACFSAIFHIILFVLATLGGCYKCLKNAAFNSKSSKKAFISFLGKLSPYATGIFISVVVMMVASTLKEVLSKMVLF